MTYETECTGYPEVDVHRPLDQQGGSFLYRGSASACKFVPTSRCLDFISFYGVRRIANVNIHFEIREDEGDKPKGAPGESTGRLADIIFSYGNIPTSFGDINVDFGLLLPAENRIYWIVIWSSDFYCSNAYISEGWRRIEMSFSWVSGNMRRTYSPSDIYCTPAGSCCWYLVGGNDSYPITTYKKKYTQECPIPSLQMIIPS